MPGRSDGSARTTPKVLVLGGGFAGVGATQKLKKADVEVVLVDRHDYHTFQPLLYQLATGLLETSAVGHSLRDLVHGQDNATVHQDCGHRDRPRRPHGRVRRARAHRLRLPRPRPRRGGQLLRDRGRGRARVPDVHAGRRRAAQGARARALGVGGQAPRARRGRRAQRRRRRRRADRGRVRGRAGGALPHRRSTRTTGDLPQEKARVVLVEAGPGALPDVQGGHSRLHRGRPREAHGRGR